MSSNNEQFNHLSYKYFFKEDDEKSRLFEDTEEDLLSKLSVINTYNLFHRNSPIFCEVGNHSPARPN